MFLQDTHFPAAQALTFKASPADFEQDFSAGIGKGHARNCDLLWPFLPAQRRGGIQRFVRSRFVSLLRVTNACRPTSEISRLPRTSSSFSVDLRACLHKQNGEGGAFSLSLVACPFAAPSYGRPAWLSASRFRVFGQGRSCTLQIGRMVFRGAPGWKQQHVVDQQLVLLSVPGNHTSASNQSSGHHRGVSCASPVGICFSFQWLYA